jgi:hypothetical protein
MNDSHLSTQKRIPITTLSLAALGLFAACSAGGGTNAPPSNSTAPNPTAYTPTATPTPARGTGQTSSQLVSADPRAQYLVIKRTFKGLVPEPDDPEDGRVNLEDCKHGSEYLGGVENDPAIPLADVAYNVVLIRKVLEKAGYPESVWRAPLLEFESGQLRLRLSGTYQYSPDEERYRAAREKIVRAVNEYREDVASDLPEVIDEGGCGAGEVGINVATEPAGGRVNLIPVFFYELCKAQQLNPDDPAQCDRWRESAEGLLTDVSGDYVYRASWPDGVGKSGRMSFTNLEEGQTVTFRKH